ncbi:MAG: nitronate monooxygenase [Paracoccus sp. (in: a-proteobacteria)]|nr:nitronate monooxygenase [Paracoccus sp. (in: a-proteobacteria)]
MTSAISGRPARCLLNDWADRTAGISDAAIAAYPCAYDLGKALNAAARAAEQDGLGAHWAGTGAAKARAMSAARLVATLAQEWRAAAQACAERLPKAHGSHID